MTAQATTNDEHEPPSCTPICAEPAASKEPKAARYMLCCVCGASAGRWQQHWNRDAGWGICPGCAAAQAGQETPDNMVRLYGRPGVNYEPPTVVHMGRRHKVMATFPESRPAQANAYMEANPGASVLAVEGGRVVIVHMADLGEPA